MNRFASLFRRWPAHSTGGGADWVSIQGAPQEILDIISRISRTDFARDEQIRPAIAAIVSAGGVGNAALAIETAVQIKRT
jgi:hypothetical protein